MKSDVFHLGDITFDPNTRTLIYKDGHPAPLRNKSRNVLSCLLEQPNQTVQKADILNIVWPDVTVSDESLVQCIADIRRLIGQEARQIVETVPREGYRINLAPPVTVAKRSLYVAPIAGVTVLLVAAWFLWPEAPVLQVETGSAPALRTSEKLPGTRNTDAFLEVLKGRVSANRFSPSESLTAERHFRSAIALDPTYARAYAELGTLLAVRFENDWTVLEDADREKALYYAKKAVSLDPDLWLAHYALGRLHSVFRNLDLAESHLEQAMQLQPDNEDARAYLGIVKIFRGKTDEAVAILEPAVRSHPNPPYWYYYGLGHALFNARRYDDAEAALNKCLVLAERSPYCLRYLMAVHGETGQSSKAQKAVRDYASVGFDLRIQSIMELMAFHHPEDQAQLRRGLRLAGVPD